MADLVVVAYDGEDTADQALNKLRQLQKEYLRIKQAIPLVRLSAAGGAAWAGCSACTVGALADYGIDDDFIKELGRSLERGKSAIFMLVRRVNVDKALPELAKFGGNIIKTNLP